MDPTVGIDTGYVDPLVTGMQANGAARVGKLGSMGPHLRGIKVHIPG